MRWSALFFAAVGVAGCIDDSAPAGPALSVSVAPLELPGISEACYNLGVTNGPDGGGDLVWQRDGVCSTAYGDGQGSLTYIGSCDADTGADNTVLLELVSLSDDQGAVAFSNPCPAAAPCMQSAPCVENADALVTFNLTILRPAEQGFFDVAVNFDDLFCSAKADCVANTGTGDGPLNLLFSPVDEVRVPTVVLAFACTAGIAADTQLYLGGLALDCGGTLLPLDVSGPAGNVYSAASPAPAPLLQLATYRSPEQLTDSQGASWSKLFFNTALALDFGALPGPCKLVGTMTASDGPFDVPFTTPNSTTYPLLNVDIPLVSDAGATSYACGRHPLGTTAADGVWVSYTGTDAAVEFDLRVSASGDAIALDSRTALVISPSSVNLAPSQTQVFTASGGSPPYSYSVVAGGGSFVGATYTAPSAEGAATVQVADAAGHIITAAITVETLSKIVFVSSTASNGDLGGLTGADATCQALADAQPALAGKTFKAWLSSSTESAAARLTHASVPYVRTDGVTIASDWTDLTDGLLLAPINRTESNASPPSTLVWTNTAGDGSALDVTGAQTCDDWTSGTSAGGGNFIGRSTRDDCGWSSASANSADNLDCSNTTTTLHCSNAFQLFCFQQ